jgi:hypothetical protein
MNFFSPAAKSSAKLEYSVGPVQWNQRNWHQIANENGCSVPIYVRSKNQFSYIHIEAFHKWYNIGTYNEQNVVYKNLFRYIYIEAFHILSYIIHTYLPRYIHTFIHTYIHTYIHTSNEQNLRPGNVVYKNKLGAYV